MKKKTTEIFIEVEETLRVMLKERSANFVKETESNQKVCPHCGQSIEKTKDLEIGGEEK